METRLSHFRRDGGGAQSSLFRNGNLFSFQSLYTLLLSQSSLFRNGNLRISASDTGSPSLNLPYLGMETRRIYRKGEKRMLLNLPYLGMETYLVLDSTDARYILNLPYLGMET